MDFIHNRKIILSLVWGLISLAIALATLLLFNLDRTLNDVDKAQKTWLSEQEQLEQLREKLWSWYEINHSRSLSRLKPERQTDYGNNAELNAAAAYRILENLPQNIEALKQFDFSEINRLIQKLGIQWQHIQDWRTAYNYIFADINQQTSLKQTRELLHKLNAGIDILMGKNKLQIIRVMKRYQAYKKHEDAEQLADMLHNLLSQQGQGLQVELTEIGRLSEQIASMRNIGQLYSLQNNALIPALDRLNRHINQLYQHQPLDDGLENFDHVYGDEHIYIPEIISQESLEQLKQSLFGKGYYYDDNKQQIHLGEYITELGLISSYQQWIKLQHRRTRLEQDNEFLFSQLEKSLQKFDNKVYATEGKTIDKVNATLGMVWHKNLYLWLGSLVAFLLLGGAIIYNVHQQMFIIERAHKTAEDNMHSRNQFVANMSHELRTPLNAVIGYSEILIEDVQDKQDELEQLPDLYKIHDAGQYLLHLVSEVLDLSKLDAKKMEIRWELIDFKAFLKQLHHTIDPALCKNNNQYQQYCDPSLQYLRVDLDKMRHVLFNLLSNACKFTQQGQIHICISRQHQQIVFEVADSGIGIPKDKHEHIFTPFSQADESSTREYDGTGLGLTICKEFVELMSGTLTVSSSERIGSVFTARFPESILIFDYQQHCSHYHALEEAIDPHNVSVCEHCKDIGSREQHGCPHLQPEPDSPLHHT